MSIICHVEPRLFAFLRESTEKPGEGAIIIAEQNKPRVTPARSISFEVKRREPRAMKNTKATIRIAPRNEAIGRVETPRKTPAQPARKAISAARDPPLATPRRRALLALLLVSQLRLPRRRRVP